MTSRSLPGRNDLCYCGSGQKYKRCCWVSKDSPRARLEAREAEHEATLARARAAFVAQCKRDGLNPDIELARVHREKQARARRLIASFGAMTAGLTPMGRRGR